MKPPKVWANWLQLVTRVGALAGPRSARPTKAATAVPTPSIGREPASTSSTYTPGDRYCGMRPSSTWTDPASLACGKPPRQGARVRDGGSSGCPNGQPFALAPRHGRAHDQRV